MGFRSIEALTDDVRIFSRGAGSTSVRFDGYCFRFAGVAEVETLLHAEGIDGATARDVAGIVPRYLVPLPLSAQPPEVARYGELGYSSVIVTPLRTPEAVALAQRQARALADLEVPLLLFLDRIAEFRIDVQAPDGEGYARRLSRSQTPLSNSKRRPNSGWKGWVTRTTCCSRCGSAVVDSLLQGPGGICGEVPQAFVRPAARVP